MGLYEYMILPESEQWNELWNNGTFLTHHIAQDHKYTLYALYGFFIEVALNPCTGKIIGKGYFKTGETLDRYSGSVDKSNI